MAFASAREWAKAELHPFLRNFPTRLKTRLNLKEAFFRPKGSPVLCHPSKAPNSREPFWLRRPFQKASAGRPPQHAGLRGEARRRPCNHSEKVPSGRNGIARAYRPDRGRSCPASPHRSSVG